MCDQESGDPKVHPGPDLGVNREVRVADQRHEFERRPPP
jgi:hypothetical protein